MRPFDNFFWCLEVRDLPSRSMVLPLQWPAPSGTRPTAIEYQKYATNRVGIQTGAAEAFLWLTPEWVDFNRPLEISVNGRYPKLPAPAGSWLIWWRMPAPERTGCTLSGCGWSWKQGIDRDLSFDSFRPAAVRIPLLPEARGVRREGCPAMFQAPVSGESISALKWRKDCRLTARRPAGECRCRTNIRWRVRVGTHET